MQSSQAVNVTENRTPAFAVGNLLVVENLSHKEALEKCPDEGAHIYYRHCGVLYRAHRMGSHYIIIDHKTGAYYLSERLRVGMLELVRHRSLEVLGVLIKLRYPLRGWMELCLISHSSPTNCQNDMQALWGELKLHRNRQLGGW